MAFFDSSISTMSLDDTGGTLRDLSAYINDVTGLPGERNINDATSLSDTGRKWHPGIQNVTFTIAGMYDDTATTGPDVVLGGLFSHTAALTFNYSPDGTITYSGECFCTSYELQTVVGDMVKFTAGFSVDGTVTRA